MKQCAHLRQVKEIALIRGLLLERSRIATQQLAGEWSERHTKQHELTERLRLEEAALRERLQAGTTLSIASIECGRASLAAIDSAHAAAATRLNATAVRLNRQHALHAAALRQSELADEQVAHAAAQLSRSEEERRADANELRFLAPKPAI
jgi:hypothetical protein